MQEKLKRLIEIFNSLQDKWEASYHGKEYIDILDKNSLWDDIITITDFLFHFDDHIFAKVMFGEEEVSCCCGSELGENCNCFKCLPNDIIINRVVIIEKTASYIYHLSKAYNIEMNEGLEKAIDYIEENIK